MPDGNWLAGHTKKVEALPPWVPTAADGVAARVVPVNPTEHDAALTLPAGPASQERVMSTDTSNKSNRREWWESKDKLGLD